MYFSLKNLKLDISSISDIQTLTEIYQETALYKMNKVRGSVLKSRRFLQGVSEIYNHAKNSYLNKKTFEQQKKSEKEWLKSLQFIKRNGKTVYALISSNQSLYGDLIIKIYNIFRNDILKLSGSFEIAIIGTVGKVLSQNDKLETKLGKKILYFDLDDEKIDQKKMFPIVKNLEKFQQIIIYFPQFETILHQKVFKSDVSGGLGLKGQTAAKAYLFEPSPEAIMNFFESEVIASLFYQSVYEAQLSRFAARAVSMDQANQNSQDLIENLEKELLKLKKIVANKKQLDRISGQSLWQI